MKDQSRKMRRDFNLFASLNETTIANDVSQTYNALVDELGKDERRFRRRSSQFDAKSQDVGDERSTESDFRSWTSLLVATLFFVLTMLVLAADARNANASESLPNAIVQNEIVEKGSLDPLRLKAENRSEASDANENGLGHAVHAADFSIHAHNPIRRFVASALHECRWLVAAAIVIAAIRRLLLADPWTEIIASGVSGAAIALHHSISLARRFVLELKWLANRLQDIAPAKSPQVATRASEIWRVIQGTAWLIAIALIVLVATDLVNILGHFPAIGVSISGLNSVSPKVISSPLAHVTEIIPEIIDEWKHVILAFALAGWLKRFLLGQSYSQIIGCGIEWIAIVLDHTISLARHAVGGLRHFASELRTHTD